MPRTSFVNHRDLGREIAPVPSGLAIACSSKHRMAQWLDVKCVFLNLAINTVLLKKVCSLHVLVCVLVGALGKRHSHTFFVSLVISKHSEVLTP